MSPSSFGKGVYWFPAHFGFSSITVGTIKIKSSSRTTYSLLVESYSFDEIEIAFLIVGHTHASIDQYFSVISKAIKKAKFIGTPMTLLELIRRCHDLTWRQRAVIKEIKVYYDMKTMFAPYINKKIKYYNLPHIYRVVPSFGHTAIFEYKVDSTAQHWNPRRPRKKLHIWNLSCLIRNLNLYLFRN